MKIELDEGYSFGRGCFETIKVVEGKALFLDLHYQRFEKSARFFELSYPSFLDWEKKVQEFLEQQTEKNFALKFLLSPENQVFLIRKDPYQRQEDKAWKLGISPYVRHSSSPLLAHKSLCYYENLLIRQEANNKAWDEALLLNEKGEVTEGAFTNVFFIQDEKIITPSLSSGLLAGTMRQYLLEHYPIEEKRVLREGLKNFTACFLSNALLGVAWVSQIEDLHYSKSPLYEKIKKDLRNFGF